MPPIEGEGWGGGVTSLRGDAGCAEAPPPLLIRGVEEFNRREFFKCHETLEELWRAEPSAVRQLYQGILQVGVGFYHLGRGNYRGATLTLHWGIERLKPLGIDCQGVSVGRLVREAEAAALEVARLGPERVREFDPRLIPVIEMRTED